jgi:hypothetical protein
LADGTRTPALGAAEIMRGLDAAAG